MPLTAEMTWSSPQRQPRGQESVLPMQDSQSDGSHREQRTAAWMLWSPRGYDGLAAPRPRKQGLAPCGQQPRGPMRPVLPAKGFQTTLRPQTVSIGQVQEEECVVAPASQLRRALAS
jgi:hypothetical protein